MQFLAVALAGLGVLLALMALGWLGRPVVYSGLAFENVQQFLANWGRALDTGSRIVLRTEGTPGSVWLVKQRYKRRPDILALRCRNADESRAYFAAVAPALLRAGIEFDTEFTKKRARVRALRISFDARDPLTPAAAAHAARVMLGAMGGQPSGPYSVHCEGRFRTDLVPGEAEFIPPTKAAKLGFSLGRLFARLRGKQ